jgi:hypothetical protein
MFRMASQYQTLGDSEIQEILADSASESGTEMEYDDEEKNNYEDMEIDQLEETSSSSSTSNCRRTRNKNAASQIWVSGNFKPHLFSFNSNQCGLIQYLVNRQLEIPLDFFHLYFDKTLLEIIASETNRYHLQNYKYTSSHAAPWVDANIDEMYVFLATTMLMTHVKKHKIQEYWSTDQLIMTPVFSHIFSRDRYLALLRYIHFNNNENYTVQDRLFKVKPIIDDLKAKFHLSLNPYQNLVIDESLMLWKGRLSFKQYIPSKRNRFGVKLYVLCNCRTGFILDFIPYTGSTTPIYSDKRLGASGSLVMKLMEKYLQKGHNLYVDNWYSTPALFEALHSMKTGACGIVRLNRIHLTNFQTINLEQYQQVFRRTDILLALKLKGRRDVHMLSTIHETNMVPTGKIDHITKNPRMKPICIKEYNENMGAIDKSDMQFSFSECIRKRIKWYKKFFFHLLDVTLLNASILYKLKTGKTIHLSDF